MAMDEALLDAVANDPSMAVVRTYEWSIPTLSLGYFQRMEDVAADPRWASVPIVRRPTGGGALWHDLEVTYAVVIPGTHPASRPSRLLYQIVHEAIAERLRSFGIPAARRGGGSEEMAGGNRPFLCFTDRDEQDIVLRNTKVVGSAQRRRGGAVLQHGSLLLGRSRMTPELLGLNDLALSFSDSTNWGELVATLLSEALRIPAIVDRFRPDEQRMAGLLRDEVYANPEWTRRR
jgi:lipoyl(octanoyl) transferase